jgi:hypothetical protein
MATVSGAPFSQNTTGTPNPDDYLLGRGELYLAELNTSDAPDANGWVHLGNCPMLELVPSSEFLEHFSSMSGTKTLDYKVLVQQKFDVKFSLEEVNETNAALFFSATAASYTNAAIAGFTEYAMITAVKKGRWYTIQNSSGQRAFGIDNTDLVVEKSGSPDTALVEGTDYEVDEVGGRIKFLSTGSTLSDGDQVDVTLTANASADSTRQIPVQSRTSVTVALMFYGTNPKTSRKYELFIPKISLAADGGFGLISENNLVGMGFTGSAERKDASTYIATITSLPTGGVT